MQARIDMLLENWDKITTVCTGVQDETEAKQVPGRQRLSLSRSFKPYRRLKDTVQNAKFRT